MTTYAVVGTGGVGGFYGVHLARTGRTVHFLIRSAAARAAEAGLTLVSGERAWTVRAGRTCTFHDDWADIPPVDVVLLATKATANPDVLPRLAPLVAAGGSIAVLQNGIDVEPAVAAAVPAAQVIGGMAFLCAERLDPVRIAHYDFGALTLGAYSHGYSPAEPTDAMQALAGDLSAAQVPVALADNLLRARWQKLLWNIPFNGLGVLLDARTDALMAAAPSVELARTLMTEVAAAARADSAELPAGSIEAMLDYTRSMVPYASSMKIDYDHRRPLETEQMYRAPLRRAAAAGVAMPATAALADALEFLDQRNRA